MGGWGGGAGGGGWGGGLRKLEGVEGVGHEGEEPEEGACREKARYETDGQTGAVFEREAQKAPVARIFGASLCHGPDLVNRGCG